MKTYSKISNKFIIAIDSVDGTGKTTLARTLSEKFNYTYLKTPSNDFLELKKTYDECFNKYPILKFYFYLNTILETYFFILNNKINNVFIIDRCTLSTYTYHKILFDELRIKNQFNIITNQWIYPIKPDLNILLIANSKVRRNRIFKRNIVSPSETSIIDFGIDFQEKV